MRLRLRPITTLHLKAGDILYSEGDRATDVYIIGSGKMAVYQGEQILGNAPVAYPLMTLALDIRI